MAEDPLPLEIAEAIEEARIDDYNSYAMIFLFKSGVESCIIDPLLAPVDADRSLQNRELCDNSSEIITSRFPHTQIKNNQVLMLGYNVFEERWDDETKFCDIRLLFSSQGLLVDSFEVKNYIKFPDMKDYNPLNNAGNPDVSFTIPSVDPDDPEFRQCVWCQVINSAGVPRPQNFEKMTDYGVVFIRTHGISDGIVACPYYANDIGPGSLQEWLLDPNNATKWRYSHTFLSVAYAEVMGHKGYIFGANDPAPADSTFLKGIMLTNNFFIRLPGDFKDSIICQNSCYGINFLLNPKFALKPYREVNAFLGVSGPEIGFFESTNFAYTFFQYMLGPGGADRMSVRDAFTRTKSDHSGIETNMELWTGAANEHDETYFSGVFDNIEITEEKSK